MGMDKFSLLQGFHDPVLADARAAAAPGRAVADVAGVIGSGAGLLARVDEERVRVRDKADRMDDAGLFEDIKTMAQEVAGKWGNEEEAGNRPGREARWGALVSKRIGPLVRKGKFKTPEMRERARLWFNEFSATGRVEAERNELLHAKDRAGRSFKARYKFCLESGDFNGARDVVETAGGANVMEPEEQVLLLQGVDFSETDQMVDRALADDPFHGLESVAAAGGLARVAGRQDVLDGYERKAEAARRKAQAGVAQGFVLDVFEGREFREEDLRRDVADGRIDVDDAMGLRLGEDRRRQAVAKMGKEAAELVTSPEDFMRVDWLLRGYDPAMDFDGVGFAEVEQAIASAMISKGMKEQMRSELKDLAVGRVPERFRGPTAEAARVVDLMVDGEVFGRWKAAKDEGDFTGYERVLATAYRVKQGMERWVLEHPDASYEVMRVEAERQAAEGTVVVPAGGVKDGLHAPEGGVPAVPKVRGSGVLDDVGWDVDAAGNAALLPPVNGVWTMEGSGGVLRGLVDGVDMKGKDLKWCYAAVFGAAGVDDVKEVAALKRMVDARWCWANGVG